MSFSARPARPAEPPVMRLRIAVLAACPKMQKRVYQLFRISVERQQYVSGQPVPDPDITRRGVNYAANDHRSRSAHRSALRGDAISRSEVAQCVEFPDHLAVACVERA